MQFAAVHESAYGPKTDTDRQLAGVETAAEEIGQKISIQNVSSERDLDLAFTTMSQLDVYALLVAADPLFTELHDQIVALASRYNIPAIYASREFVAAGGVISYGASAADAYRGAGVYARKNSQRCQACRFAGPTAN
jgi:putative tryptophan/tyrosine transport system substrate-binding protein